MAIKDILIHIDTTPHCEKRFRLGVEIAQQHGADIFALFVQSDSFKPSFTSNNERLCRERKEKGQQIKNRLQPLADQARVKVHWEVAKCNSETNRLTDQLIICCHHTDMAIVGQYDSSTANGILPEDLAEHMVLETGRPILVVPHAGEFSKIGQRVMIAWDTSRESVRAVNDAIPLIRQAKKVHVVAINPRKGRKMHGKKPAADITAHLVRHNIKAEASYLKGKQMDEANMLLSWAADESIDLLVMGAYGHHRFRELILGGMTQTILKHMTVPVLMSH
ncbi:MAG: universal stress protein [Gammaproteobacteria bacterium]|nr:universal stress protein [Gammaproteobacteria bacterium]